MSRLIVKKFGGTSVQDIDCIRRVASIVHEAVLAGEQVVVVVSAMAGETNRLEKLGYDIAAEPNDREMDVLLATGEQVSVALLSIALEQIGVKAQSYLGFQIPIETDSQHRKARIQSVQTEGLRKALSEGIVPVVAGFQGIDNLAKLTTLGRGGSDTTAVALAAALKADECQIYTDVDGVYTTDPRIEPKARRMPRVTFEEMLELASLGAKVLQIRSVEFAGKYNVPLRVLSTFKEGAGTLISYEEKGMEQPVVSGIAFNRDEARFSLLGVPEAPGTAAKILGPISQAGIEVDMIIQNMPREGLTDFTFTVHRRDFDQTVRLLQKVQESLQARAVVADKHIVKVSLVGVGMRSHAGIASQMFSVLAREGINIQLIATSEIKISVVMDEKYLELGVRTLHEAFALHEDPIEEKKNG